MLEKGRKEDTAKFWPLSIADLLSILPFSISRDRLDQFAYCHSPEMKFYFAMIITVVFLRQCCNAVYQVGTGIADVTGPAAEVFLVTYNICFLFSLLSVVLSPVHKLKRCNNSREYEEF